MIIKFLSRWVESIPYALYGRQYSKINYGTASQRVKAVLWQSFTSVGFRGRINHIDACREEDFNKWGTQIEFECYDIEIAKKIIDKFLIEEENYKLLDDDKYDLLI